MNVVTCLREFAQILTRYALIFHTDFLTTHPTLAICENIDVNMNSNTHICYIKESIFWIYDNDMNMISWMECYYLDARTSDTISSYQVQTPQIEIHNTQDRSQGCNGAWGMWITKKGYGKQRFLKK